MQLTTILVRQGEQSPGEDWVAIHDLEEHGAGIGILKRRVKIGWELLVEFRTAGIVSRRCLVGILDPTTPGVTYIVMPQFFEAIVDTVIALYRAEITGGFPLLTVAVITGNSFIAPLRALAPTAFENRQLRLIEQLPPQELLDWGNSIGMVSNSATIEFDGDEDTQEFTTLPPPEDDKPSAFDNWDGADEPDNEG